MTDQLSPFAQHLQNSYFHAKTANPSLTKGKFMQLAYPELPYAQPSKDVLLSRSRNASARRQYNKLISGETSGKKYEKRGGTPKVVTHVLYGKRKGQTIGGGLEGLWKVNVHYDYRDEHGVEQETARSFICQSSVYTTMEDIPYLYAIMPEIVEQFSRRWQDSGSEPIGIYEIKTEILPIRRSEVPAENRIDLDTLEIEDYDEDDGEY